MRFFILGEPVLPKVFFNFFAVMMENVVANLTNRWVVLALLFFARASMAMQFQSIPPIATLLVEKLGFNFTQVGLLIGIWMLPGFFIALPGGLLGQRFGDKTVVIAGLSLQVVGAVVFANANVFQVAIAGRLLGGVGAVALNVQLTKIVNDWFAEKEISTSMGILMTAWPFGIALALFTLGHVAVIWDWRTAIYLTAGYSFLSLSLVAVLYHDRTATEPKELARHYHIWSISRRELITIISASLVWALPNVSFIVLMGFMPALLVSNGMEMAKAGMLVSLTSWITIGSIPLGGWLTDRTGRVNSFIIGGGPPKCLVHISFAAGWLGPDMFAAAWHNHGRLAGSNHGPTQSGFVPPKPFYGIWCVLHGFLWYRGGFSTGRRMVERLHG